jgi:hypothetical protein
MSQTPNQKPPATQPSPEANKFVALSLNEVARLQIALNLLGEGNIRRIQLLGESWGVKLTDADCKWLVQSYEKRLPTPINVAGT